jgi:hypothetical protein
MLMSGWPLMVRLVSLFLFCLCANLCVLFAVVDFYNQINLLYGAITEFCSPQTCPEMKATDEYEVLVLDAGKLGLTIG